MSSLARFAFIALSLTTLWAQGACQSPGSATSEVKDAVGFDAEDGVRLDGAGAETECSPNQQDAADGCDGPPPTVCEPGATGCHPFENAVTTCDSTGTRLQIGRCESGARCVESEFGPECRDDACEPTVVGCLDAHQVFECDAVGTAMTDRPCDEGFGCAFGACKRYICQPDCTRRVQGAYLETCDPNGLGFGNRENCGQGVECDGFTSDCSPEACALGSTYCDGDMLMTCNADGTGYGPTRCSDTGLTCVESEGSASCGQPPN